MAIYAVVRANPYFKQGTTIECFDHGCQKVSYEQKGSYAKPINNEGVAIPLDVMRPFVMKVLKKGLDKGVRRQ